jgi:hypothetical protein
LEISKVVVLDEALNQDAYVVAMQKYTSGALCPVSGYLGKMCRAQHY